MATEIENELLNTYSVKRHLSVAWGEMDSFLHVNNVVYFKYFETARIAYFEKAILDINARGVGPILKSTHCDFKIPLTYPDNITVGAKVESIQKDRFLMHYIVVSENHQKVAALGSGMVVVIDYTTGRPIEIPNEVRERMVAMIV